MALTGHTSGGAIETPESITNVDLTELLGQGPGTRPLAQYYREISEALRARAVALQSRALAAECLTVAAEFKRLAEYEDSFPTIEESFERLVHLSARKRLHY